MFTSWQPIANDDGSVLLFKRKHTFDPVTAKTERPSACSLCRAQKVRCTGGRSCKRCQTLGRKCTYPPRHCSTATSLAPGDSGPGSSATEQWPDLLETEIPEELGPLASRDQAAHERSGEAQGGYSSGTDDFGGYSGGTDFFAFPLDQEFTLSPAVPTAHCDNDVQNNMLIPEQILTGQEHSLLGSGQHQEIYPGADNNCSPHLQSRVPQAEALFSNQIHTHRQSRADTPPSKCQCLHEVVLLIDELELITEPNANANLPVDGVLSAHHKALRQAEGMLACPFCAVRVENMTILTFLVSRLTDLCCRACSRASPPATEALTTVVGAFRVESETECVAVVRVLLRLGLDRLFELISALQGAGRQLCSEVMGRRLGVCRRAVRGLLDEMGPPPGRTD